MEKIIKDSSERKEDNMIAAIRRYFGFCRSNGLVVDVGVVHNIVDAYEESLRYDRTPTGSHCVFSWALEKTLKEWEQPDWLKLVLEGVDNFEDLARVSEGVKEWTKKFQKENAEKADPDAKVSHEHDMVNKPLITIAKAPWKLSMR